jgi:hypothetical protein
MPGIHHETVKDILRDDLNMGNVNFKLVPHTLNSFHKPVRAEMPREYLDLLANRTG